MLPLVHNTTLMRNRSNTMPSGSNTRSSNNHISTNDASSSYTNSNNNNTQYGVETLTKDNSSDCKKLKSKVCITTNNRPFLKKRSLTFSSLFSPKSRSQSTNSLQPSLVDQTIASVLRSVNINEFLNGSITVSELNLNQPQSDRFFSSDHNLCKSSSTTSTVTTNDDLLTESNLVNSFSDLEFDHSNDNQSINYLNRQQSTNELNNQSISQTDLVHQQQSYSQTESPPSFPPPSYTPIDPKRIRRPLLFRSQSAPQAIQQFRSSASNSEFVLNSHILENIQENSDLVLSEVREEEEDQMASRRNSYLNHQFNCRLAHEKEIVRIPGFNTVKELYERISHAFNINIDQILFCTLNTNKVDMDNLFERQINLKDIIYVHIRGQAKEIEIQKTDPLLGLTICDNQNGLCLIKKIKDGSVIDKIKFIKVGDVIERINNINLYGYRHIDVANMLKAIPSGEVFVIRLIESRRDSDESNTLHLSKHLKNKIKKGYETLRIRAKGPAIFEEDDTNDDLVEKINLIIEDFVGISDSDLVQQIMDIGRAQNDPHEFLVAINQSDLRVFNFSEEILFDIWGAIRDAKLNS